MESSSQAVVVQPPSAVKLLGAVLFFIACAVAAKFMPGWQGIAVAVGSVLMASAAFGLLLKRVPSSKSVQSSLALAGGVAMAFVVAAAWVVLPFGTPPHQIFASSSSRGDAVRETESATPSVRPLPKLSVEDQQLVARIKIASSLDGMQGFEIGARTAVYFVGDNFGENKVCSVRLRPTLGEGVARVAKWDLVLQLGDTPVVWTNNLISDDVGEVRVTLSPSGKRFILNKRMTGGGLGMPITSEFLAELFSSQTGEAVSGVILDKPMSGMFDLSAVERAYSIAVAVCGK